MENFQYASPYSVKDATGMLSNKWGEVEVLAGGTDLVSLMKEYLVSPRLVVNVKGIKELHGINVAKNSVRIGAAVTLDDIAENAAIAKSLPSLREAALGVSSPQIRNMGTIGGDICQRPRCWYYRQGFGLLGKASRREVAHPRRRESLPRDSGQWRTCVLCQRFEFRSGAGGFKRYHSPGFVHRVARCGGGEVLRHAHGRGRAGNRHAAERNND